MAIVRDFFNRLRISGVFDHGCFHALVRDFCESLEIPYETTRFYKTYSEALDDGSCMIYIIHSKFGLLHVIGVTKSGPQGRFRTKKCKETSNTWFSSYCFGDHNTYDVSTASPKILNFVGVHHMSHEKIKMLLDLKPRRRHFHAQDNEMVNEYFFRGRAYIEHTCECYKE